VTARTPARVAAALAALALVVSLAACTKSSPKQDTSSTSSSAPSTPTRSIDQTGPVSVGNITEKTTSSCPYLSFDTAKNDAGMRLQRIATLYQNGKVVGCRFFPAVFTSEKLPPTTQVVIEIVVSEYANHTAANNALLLGVTVFGFGVFIKPIRDELTQVFRRQRFARLKVGEAAQ